MAMTTEAMEKSLEKFEELFREDLEGLDPDGENEYREKIAQILIDSLIKQVGYLRLLSVVNTRALIPKAA